MNQPVPNSKRRPQTFQEGYKLLIEDQSHATPPPERAQPSLMPLEEIQLLETVFQRRLFLDQVRIDGGGRGLPMGDGDALTETDFPVNETDEVSETAASEQHVRVLQEAILASADGLMDPVTVWWSGQRWICIDGHHRILAYKRLKHQGKKIPEAIAVNVQPGGFEAAIQAAIKLNSKDKLNMSRADKLEAAWLMVRMGSKEFTVSVISSTTQVSKRTVDNMRAGLKRFKELFPRACDSMIVNLTWQEVLRKIRGEEEWTENKIEQQAKEWSNRLAKTFGTKFATQPEIAARALELYSTSLVSSLAEYWSHEQMDSQQSDF